MGIYATVTSLQTLMVGTNLTTTSSLAADLINRAERRINSLLARRYDLTASYFQTTTSIPPQVREWATELATGYMWQHLARGGAGKESMERGEKAIKCVMDDLKMLSKFELELVNSTGSVIADMSDTSYRVLCNSTDYEPTFDEADELNWVVDPDKVEDISNAKD